MSGLWDRFIRFTIHLVMLPSRAVTTTTAHALFVCASPPKRLLRRVTIPIRGRHYWSVC
jgi:hypothetical protein